MSRSLILHIGHHRTGTTTLQELVFPQLTRIRYFHKDRIPVAATIVRAFGWDPYLLAAHLREGQAAARRAGFEELKVIVGIRRQDQYLGSLYAKAGFQAETPGQVDFERQVLEIIDPKKRYFLDGVWLDYELTRDLIAQAIGKENVLMIPLEQLGTEPQRYLSALSSFVGEPVNPESVAAGRLNSRSLTTDSWQIKKDAMKWSARKKPFGSYRALLAGPIQISLSASVKEQILATYRQSNEALASALNIDLAQFGYYGSPSD
jgi:hypothetical protein